MYLRTLLYALRQGVALDSGDQTPTSALPIALTGGVDDHSRASSTANTVANPEGATGKVPDRLLDLYLSSQDSISLTSKVLDVYAAYVDEGEVSRVSRAGGTCIVPHFAQPIPSTVPLFHVIYT